MATAVSTPADLSPAPTPAPRRRGRPPKNPAPAEAPGSSPVSPLAAAAASEADAGGEYERQRAARIRENMERMQKLGILDLAHTLSHSAAASGSGGRRRRKPVEQGSVDAARVKPSPPPPSRRSLRYGPKIVLFAVVDPCPGYFLVMPKASCLRIPERWRYEAVECAKIYLFLFLVQHVLCLRESNVVTTVVYFSSSERIYLQFLFVECFTIISTH